MQQSSFLTPLGYFYLAQCGEALIAARFCAAPVPGADTPLLREAQRQLQAYFRGQLRTFTLPLAPRGTPFQLAVWAAMDAIPYGQTATYGDLARAIGRPRATRAVGQACHCNPLGVLRPCHRVVGKGGALTGYAAGLTYKEALLRLEGALPPEGGF